MQCGPKEVASRTEVQGAMGCGGFQRSGPTGGAAKGMPRKMLTAESAEDLPRSWPESMVARGASAAKESEASESVRARSAAREMACMWPPKKIEIWNANEAVLEMASTGTRSPGGGYNTTNCVWG